MTNKGNEPKMLKLDYPGNSQKSKTEPKKKEKQKQVTTGRVVQKKKSLGKKFAETFLGDSVEGVSSYIIHDVIIPAAKNMMSDSIRNGVDMLLFGQVKGNRTTRDRNQSYVSYNNPYNQTGRTNVNRANTVRNERERKYSNKSRSRHNFDDIVLETRGEAEEVLSHLVDLTEDYGMASVGDLYDLVGITSNFTDDKYGWDNLSTATVERIRDGYLIHLPRTIVLD